MIISLQARGKGGAGPSSLHTTLERPIKWVQDGCTVCMASNGSCFMVTWIVFNNHVFEVGLKQNRETMALWESQCHQFIIFLSCVRTPPLHVMNLYSIWLRASSDLTSHYAWGPVILLHDFGSVLGQPLDTSFGLSQYLVHGSWFVCEKSLKLCTSVCAIRLPWRKGFIICKLPWVKIRLL
jgi:hypothetical protein